MVKVSDKQDVMEDSANKQLLQQRSTYIDAKFLVNLVEIVFIAVVNVVASLSFGGCWLLLTLGVSRGIFCTTYT